MKRNFISLNDAEKAIFKEFTLLDDDLFIKKSNQNETVSIEPIKPLDKFGKNDVNAFAKKCLSKGQELLVEIDSNILEDTDFIKIEILTFQKLEDGSYYKIENNFEPNTIKLLEFDCLKQILLTQDEYNVVVVLPSKVDSNSLFLSKKTSVIIVGDHFSKRRNELNELRLGCDLYIFPKDPALFDKHQSWQVELEEVSKDVFNMRKRNYYFIRPLSDEEMMFLSSNEQTLYKKLINNKNRVIVNFDNNQISNESLSPVGKELISINRLDLEMFLLNGGDNIKNLIEVYNQENLRLYPVSLEESLHMKNIKSLR